MRFNIPIDPLIAFLVALFFAFAVVLTAVASMFGAQWYLVALALLLIVLALGWLARAVFVQKVSG